MFICKHSSNRQLLHSILTENAVTYPLSNLNWHTNWYWWSHGQLTTGPTSAETWLCKRMQSSPGFLTLWGWLGCQSAGLRVELSSHFHAPSSLLLPPTHVFSHGGLANGPTSSLINRFEHSGTATEKCPHTKNRALFKICGALGTPV